ncbi:MAG: hypothetical protein K1X67_16165 [Fimbriimonadaceae bacterium]|nr:hypothetical protein [Fimbriimonadaceae bacterium]
MHKVKEPSQKVHWSLLRTHATVSGIIASLDPRSWGRFMDMPKPLKKVLAIAGIATGLTGMSFAAEQKREGSFKTPDTVVDVSKLPKKFSPQSGNYEKALTPAILEAADKVCHAKHFFLNDSVTVQADDRGASITTSVSCGDAHSAAHSQRTKPKRGR